MRAIIYAPQASDGTSGTILQMVQGSPSAVTRTAAILSARWLEVAPEMTGAAFSRLDATHRVQAGALVPLGPSS